MLTAYPAADAASPAARAASWVDLLDPTDAERSSVEGKYGFRLPSRRELSEIETSSRISEENGVLYLSMPIVAYAGALDQAPAPLGFVLSKDVLVTIRYTPLRSFEAVAAKFSKDGLPGSSVEAFTSIVDEMVDLLADLLEAIAAELDEVSRNIFARRGKGRRRQLSQSNDALRGVLTEVGNVESARLGFATSCWVCNALSHSLPRRRGPGSRKRARIISRLRKPISCL